MQHQRRVGWERLTVNERRAIRELGEARSQEDIGLQANIDSVLLQFLCLHVSAIVTDDSETSCHLGQSNRPLRSASSRGWLANDFPAMSTLCWPKFFAYKMRNWGKGQGGSGFL